MGRSAISRRKALRAKGLSLAWTRLWPKTPECERKAPRTLTNHGDKVVSVQNVNLRLLKRDGEPSGCAVGRSASGVKHRPNTGTLQPIIEPTLPESVASRLGRSSAESARRSRSLGALDTGFQAPAASIRPRPPRRNLALSFEPGATQGCEIVRLVSEEMPLYKCGGLSRPRNLSYPLPPNDPTGLLPRRIFRSGSVDSLRSLLTTDFGQCYNYCPQIT